VIATFSLVEIFSAWWANFVENSLISRVKCCHFINYVAISLHPLHQTFTCKTESSRALDTNVKYLIKHQKGIKNGTPDFFPLGDRKQVHISSSHSCVLE
jgi:hypothetical protein